MTAPTVTERDAVLRERDAFQDGVHWAWFNNYSQSSGAKFNHLGFVVDRADERYPLPKITRRRVVVDSGGWDFTVNADGELMGREPAHVTDGVREQFRVSDRWWPLQGNFLFTNERIRLWGDLLANPDETVDA